MIKPIRFPDCYLLFALLCLVPGRLKAGAPVRIDYFYEPGCPECRQVSETVIPALSNIFYGAYLLNFRDLGVTTNYLALVSCQEAAESIKNETVYMAVNETRLFSGLAEIKSGVYAAVDEILQEQPGAANLAVRISGPSMAVCAPVSSGGNHQARWSGRSADGYFRNISVAAERDGHHPTDHMSKNLINERFRKFTVIGVILAGLVDSLNPCAISTLIFFVSILSLSGFRKREFVGAGIWFCAASFLTYIAIGFGLLRFLHGCAGFPYIQLGLELGMGSLLTVMAVLSLYDAWQFHRTGNPDAVTLKLPLRVKLIMNAIMMRLPKSRHVALAAFLIGAAVTALESVCTGQVYVPTLVLVIKSGAAPLLGFGYLLLYNLMFILPLVIVLALAARGMSVQRLVAWSKKEVVISKIALAGLFIVLAFVLIFM